MAITYEQRIAFTYPAGEQTLHANFAADETGFHFASRGKLFAYTTAGARNASGDIQLENLPTNQTVWGLTRLADQRWAVLTRETLSQQNRAGTLRTFTSAGSAEHVKEVPAVLQGFLAERFSAPKSLTQVGNNLYVRVVRSVSGNMRFLRFDLNGDVQEADLTLNQASPTSLSDTGSPGETNLLIVQQNERKVYVVSVSNFNVDTSETADLQAQNTSPFGVSATQEHLYVADRGGYIYQYSGIEPPKPPASTPGQGAPGIMQFMVLNEMLGRDMRNRRDIYDLQ